MATKTLAQIAEHSKAAWGVGKLLGKLATNAFSQLRTKRSYAKKIKILEDERDAKLAKKMEEQEKLVTDMMAFLAGREGGFVTGLKSISYAVGSVGFRQMKPSVEITDGFTMPALIAKLARRRKRWLRFKPELNKQAILSDFHDGTFKKVKGIEIKQGNEFFVSLAPRGKDRPEIISVPLPRK
ncbi:MAG: host-nuclease inhibitor Gam family protein [Candidatus Paceibacterota bacterium]